MGRLLHGLPTVGSQVLRALLRFPSRTAFAWDGGSMTYCATVELIGRMQRVFLGSGIGRGQHVAILTANRAESSCAATAALLCPASITWLHPLASLED
jgi:fatty-acyl-CoA synthase